MNKKLIFITPEMIDWSVIDAIANTVDVIIYRSKTKDYHQMLTEVKRIMGFCQKTIVMVNDDVDLCLESMAGGVVISRDDANAIFVRERIGDRRLIGYRTSSLKDLQVASAAKVDFLLAGNMFFDTDKIRAKMMSIEEVRLIKSITKIPVILTGGLTIENIDNNIINVSDGLAFSSYLTVDTSARITIIRNMLRGIK